MMLPFKIVILWTDALLYFLLIMLVVFVFIARHREHLRTPWRLVFSRRLSMAAFVVLSTFLLLTFADSIHFRNALKNTIGSTQTHYSTQLNSVLDLIVGDLEDDYEKTYSAPFATHSYVKESIELQDGSQMCSYPRLKHGVVHLHKPTEGRFIDLASIAYYAVIQAIFLWAIMSIVILSIIVWRKKVAWKTSLGKIFSGEEDVAWRTALLTMGVLIVVFCLAANFSTFYHILGTDKVGQDVFYQSLKSIRTGILIGTLTTFIMLPFAVFLGAIAGYLGGWVDDVIQYIYTTLSSIPGVLLIAASILSLQVFISNHPDMFPTLSARADARLLALCLILGIRSWVSLCRLLRAETLKLCEIEYIHAAKALGVRSLRIISRHIVPNVMHIILITIVLDFSSLVLAEAVLSYVGVGVDPTTLSWGNMINGARLELAREPIVWWPLLAAFTLMFTVVLSANLFADAVRDAFDPRIRQSS